ncbi:hypothetical protein DFJ77DRAFT_257492 [Powellomyces hirtus]|nr:hypothetical protein DFJ77DRAFT_257492 [Powellomyces hirtus]
MGLSTTLFHFRGFRGLHRIVAAQSHLGCATPPCAPPILRPWPKRRPLLPHSQRKVQEWTSASGGRTHYHSLPAAFQSVPRARRVHAVNALSPFADISTLGIGLWPPHPENRLGAFQTGRQSPLTRGEIFVCAKGGVSIRFTRGRGCTVSSLGIVPQTFTLSRLPPPEIPKNVTVTGYAPPHARIKQKKNDHENAINVQIRFCRISFFEQSSELGQRREGLMDRFFFSKCVKVQKRKSHTHTRTHTQRDCDLPTYEFLPHTHTIYSGPFLFFGQAFSKNQNQKPYLLPLSFFSHLPTCMVDVGCSAVPKCHSPVELVRGRVK